MEVKFYKCQKCGQIVEKIHDVCDSLSCCGEQMQLLTANSVDAATEKHVPSYTIEDGKIIVTIGSVEHPMTEEHYILWIAMAYDNKIVRVNLTPNDSPSTKFCYHPGATIYAYCNLHGLWKADVE